MAVRVDGTGEHLRRTANIPDDALFSACGWAKITTDRNTYSTVFALESGSPSATNYIHVQTGSDGLSLQVSLVGTSNIAGPTLVVGEWFWWGFTSSGGANGTLYFARATDASITTYAQSGTRTAFTPAEMSTGNNSYDEWLDGCNDGLKVWDAALSADEIAAERWSRRPVRTQDLNVFVPMLDADVTNAAKDWSGNGRDMTVTGTLSIEHGAPVGWGAAPIIVNSASGVYTLIAETGAYTWTGNAAGLNYDGAVGEGAEAWWDHHADADAWWDRNLVPEYWWADEITRAPAGGGGGVTLTADTASYSLTGNAAALRWSHVLPAASASYAWTGNAAGVLHGHKITAETASYTWAGNAAGLIIGRKLTAETATYTWTGIAAGLAKGVRLTADVASYSLTGNAAALLHGHKITAETASYTWTGNDAGLAKGIRLTADTASYPWTANDASFNVARRLTAAPAAYTWTGHAATLTVAAATPPQTASPWGYRVAPLIVRAIALIRPIEEADEFETLHASVAVENVPRETSRATHAAPIPLHAQIRCDDEAEEFSRLTAQSITHAALRSYEEPDEPMPPLRARHGLPNPAILAWWMHNAN